MIRIVTYIRILEYFLYQGNVYQIPMFASFQVEKTLDVISL